MKKFTHTKYLVLTTIFFMVIISTLKVIYFYHLEKSTFDLVLTIISELAIIVIISINSYTRSILLGYSQLGYDGFKKGFIRSKLRMNPQDFIYILYLLITILDFTLQFDNSSLRLLWLSIYTNLSTLSSKLLYGSEDMYLSQFKEHVFYKDIVSIRKNKSGYYTLLTEGKDYHLVINAKEHQFIKSKIREIDLDED